MKPNELLCFRCMQPLSTPGEVCPHCGHDNRNRTNGHGMLPETILGGQYQVGMLLGRGGFGATYIGYDLNMQRRVAIKEYFPTHLVMRNDTTQALSVLSDCEEQYKKGCDHALRESQMAASLGQMNGVVQAYNAFITNNTVYIVMEYVDGQTLTQYVKEHGDKLTLSRALELLAPIAEALYLLHKRKVIHRDVKPDNIMVRTGSEQAVLLDFGAARIADERTLSNSASIVSAGYAPVEQYNLSSLDGRIDQYSLAATLVYALTGNRPPDVMQRIAMPGSMPSLTAANKSVNTAAEKVLYKGMSMKAQDRYPDIPTFWAALGGKPVGALAAAKVGKKNNAGKFAIAAALLALLAAAGFFALPAFQNSSTVTPESTAAITTEAPAAPGTDAAPSAAPSQADPTATAIPVPTSTPRPTPAAGTLLPGNDGITITLPALPQDEEIERCDLYRKTRQDSPRLLHSFSAGDELVYTDTTAESGQI